MSVENENLKVKSNDKLSKVELGALTFLALIIIGSILLNLLNANRLESEVLYSWLGIGSAFIMLVWGLNAMIKPAKIAGLIGFSVTILIHYLKFVA
ncbi:hypothetical protein [Aliivibrio logei]|uniref:Uncharacterized protein n=1 Tax=Aliivibrio logei TaxID=688 RepID=A0A1B9NT67_ALILO|nr:hypothetical protein [Aliivibrio logei]OCH15418.1 hypothetical protein A6E04_20735 [Aliivibrio logei]